LSYTRVL